MLDTASDGTDDRFMATLLFDPWIILCLLQRHPFLRIGIEEAFDQSLQPVTQVGPTVNDLSHRLVLCRNFPAVCVVERHLPRVHHEQDDTEGPGVRLVGIIATLFRSRRRRDHFRSSVSQ